MSNNMTYDYYVLDLNAHKRIEMMRDDVAVSVETPWQVWDANR